MAGKFKKPRDPGEPDDLKRLNERRGLEGNAMDLQTNLLYYGDNLEILRRYIPHSSIDLIYLDPPFNSQRSYNILFKESEHWSEAQVKAFGDT